MVPAGKRAGKRDDKAGTPVRPDTRGNRGGLPNRGGPPNRISRPIRGNRPIRP
ncbi:hypothetical protein JCM13210_09640 [Thermaerobacter litoralis]